MGAKASKVKEDKALQLCRERKKFVRQALDGRCSLAVAHVVYIQSLRRTGTALRKFVEPEAHVDPSSHHSRSATPEPLALMEKSPSQLSFSFPSVSQRHNAIDALSPSPSPPPRPPSSTTYRANHMKVTGSYSKEVSEKVPSPVMGRVIFSGERRNSEPPSMEPAIPLWDFFGLSHPIDNQFSSEEGKGMDQRFERDGDIRRFQEEEGMPELEDPQRNVSSLGSERCLDSDDEFNEPSTDTLVRRFENVNRVVNYQNPITPCKSPAKTVAASETNFWSGDRGTSQDLISFRGTPSTAAPPADAKRPLKDDPNEKKVAPKDFYSSIKDIEFLFIKASVWEGCSSETGSKQAAFPSNIAKTRTASISCGQDPQPAQEEPAQAAVKYLTWHRTTSSRSTSSGNLLGSNANDDMRELNGSYVENSCMISGSHASTLDRLYAWERKLYDEVKASQKIRRDYDLKCKLLRQLESQKSSSSIEKTRVIVKDLHSMIKVAIHRIDSISKRIEELRDWELQPQLEELIEEYVHSSNAKLIVSLCCNSFYKWELQPQLEELIKELSRMWELMFECHKLQFKIISVAYCNSNARIPLQLESHKQIVLQLENELGSLSTSFTKWIGAQKSYLQSINDWLFKCVSLEEMTAKRKKRRKPQPKDKVRRFGPPIYTTCIEWLEMLEKLPEKEGSDSIKCLAAEVRRFLPQQEKSQGKGSDAASRDDALEDFPLSIDLVRSSMVVFLDKLNRYAEPSVNEYASLEKTISELKFNHDKLKGG